MSAKATQPDGESIDGHGYVVIADGEAIITFRSRHAAVGFASVWERGSDCETQIEAEQRADANSLPTLLREPAAAEVPRYDVKCRSMTCDENTLARDVPSEEARGVYDDHECKDGLKQLVPTN